MVRPVSATMLQTWSIWSGAFSAAGVGALFQHSHAGWPAAILTAAVLFATSFWCSHKAKRHLIGINLVMLARRKP